MADVIKVATREAYGKALVELGENNDKVIVLDADLAAATKTGMFKKAFPDRFFDAGIAEANMIGVAAGLATTGYTVFASSFAMFAAGRAFEQIRNTIGYPHLNVKIGATHAGISVGEDGASHQCCEDIALMRTIPGMVVINPADDVEARAAVLAMADYEGPAYLRFGRLAVPRVNSLDYKFELGKGVQLCEGKDVTIVATGLMVGEALAAKEILGNEGIDARVINIHTIKPLDKDIILAAAFVAVIYQIRYALVQIFIKDTFVYNLRMTIAVQTVCTKEQRKIIMLFDLVKIRLNIILNAYSAGNDVLQPMILHFLIGDLAVLIKLVDISMILSYLSYARIVHKIRPAVTDIDDIGVFAYSQGYDTGSAHAVFLYILAALCEYDRIRCTYSSFKKVLDS